VVSATNAGSAGVTVSGTGNALSIAGAANYGTVPDGTSSSPTTFTVVNHSSTTVSPTVTSPAGSQFTATSDSCAGSTLGPHRTCHIAVVFAPTGIGSAQANLTASTTPGVTTSVTLSGIGSWFAIHPQTKDYGTVSVGSSATATFTITNMVSTAEGADTSLQTTGGFSITSDMCNGVTLAPGASCTIVVSFTPSVTGASYSGTLDLIFPFVLVGQITVFGRGG